MPDKPVYAAIVKIPMQRKSKISMFENGTISVAVHLFNAVEVNAHTIGPHGYLAISCGQNNVTFMWPNHTDVLALCAAIGQAGQQLSDKLDSVPDENWRP